MQSHQKGKRHQANWEAQKRGQAAAPPAPKPTVWQPKNQPAAPKPPVQQSNSQPADPGPSRSWTCKYCARRFQSDLALTLHNAHPEHDATVKAAVSGNNAAIDCQAYHCHVCDIMTTGTSTLQVSLILALNG